MSRTKAKIGKTLFSREQIEARLEELAEGIQRRYIGRELTVVAVLKGSLVFTADLVRRLDLPVRVDILEVSSYFNGTKPSGEAVLSSYLVRDVRGRDVLVVDDIVDTGATLARVVELLRTEKPKSIATCVFLNKTVSRRTPVQIDFCGFELKTSDFVVGYGLDYAQRYRNLPYLAMLDKAERSKKPVRRKTGTGRARGKRSDLAPPGPVEVRGAKPSHGRRKR